MSDFKADLHCHTTCSDGSFTVEDLIKHAKKVGLKGLAITDHDTIKAYQTAFKFAEEEGIELIPAVEFSTMINDQSVHMLGYCFDLEDQGIKELCHRHANRRTDRNYKILNNLQRLGIPITEKEVLDNLPPDHSKKAYGRPNIAQVMMKKGFVSSIKEAFDLYLAEGKPAYEKEGAISTADTIDVIHKAKGLAILAHPHLLKNEETLKLLLELPFDGIECVYANFKPEENQRWFEIAARKNWLATGGSDFHGTVKPHIELGASTVDEKIFRTLQNHFLMLKK